MIVRPRYIGISYSYGKPEVVDLIKPTLPQNAKILDVGAGGGVYREIFGKQYYWVAIDVWPETIKYLSTKYNEAINCDIREYQYTQNYDLIIFGDIIEHLTYEDAREVLNNAKLHTKAILMAVPYQLKQEAINNNQAELHIQDDLTLDICKMRYPEFELIHLVTKQHNPLYGYYYYIKQED